MTVAVKVCGITNMEDALMVARAGADYLGFVLSDSLRRIDPETARHIIAALPDTARAVGVFVDEPLEDVNRLARQCGLDFVQLQGRESPEYCLHCEVPVLKGIHMGDPEAVRQVHDYDVAALLFDTFVPGKAGGTGQAFDRRLLRALDYNGPFFLAGGLTPDTVGEAIRETSPFGVDVSSGVARSPRQKDQDLVHQFLEAAHNNQKERRYAGRRL